MHRTCAAAKRAAACGAAGGKGGHGAAGGKGPRHRSGPEARGRKPGRAKGMKMRKPPPRGGEVRGGVRHRRREERPRHRSGITASCAEKVACACFFPARFRTSPPCAQNQPRGKLQPHPCRTHRRAQKNIRPVRTAGKTPLQIPVPFRGHPPSPRAGKKEGQLRLKRKTGRRPRAQKKEVSAIVCRVQAQPAFRSDCEKSFTFFSSPMRNLKNMVQ